MTTVNGPVLICDIKEFTGMLLLLGFLWRKEGEGGGVISGHRTQMLNAVCVMPITSNIPCDSKLTLCIPAVYTPSACARRSSRHNTQSATPSPNCTLAGRFYLT